jgi:hypothetical protein
MIITYFTSSGIVEQLIGSDPMSPKNLQIRKKHLYQMFEIIVGALKK